MEKPNDTDFLRSFLEDQDHSCPRCAYNLRGIQGSTCPECGELLQLRVGLVYPKLAALITGLIGISAGLGLNGLLLVFWIIMWVREGYLGPDNTFLIFNVTGAMLESGLLASWLVMWQKIHKLPATGRWTLTAGCWLITLGNIIWFTMIIR